MNDDTATKLNYQTLMKIQLCNIIILKYITVHFYYVKKTTSLAVVFLSKSRASRVVDLE